MIVHDDEHDRGARITLERDPHHAPFAITCGIYGWMLHTRFLGSATIAESEFEQMKKAIEAILDQISSYEASDDAAAYDATIGSIERFVAQFP